MQPQCHRAGVLLEARTVSKAHGGWSRNSQAVQELGRGPRSRRTTGQTAKESLFGMLVAACLRARRVETRLLYHGWMASDGGNRGGGLPVRVLVLALVLVRGGREWEFRGVAACTL